jgi:hypothetical protein
MRMFFAFFLSTVVMWSTAFAQFDSASYAEWTNSMLSKLPFKNGVLTRQDYNEIGKTYLRGLVEFYETVSARKIDYAKKHGRPMAADQIKRRADAEIARATRYVAETERGLFLSLDPEGSGTISMAKARVRLMQLALHADFNQNAILEPIEADIAEAALVKGVDLANDPVKDEFLRDLDCGAFRPLD